MTTRVAILGSGVGSMAAAFALTAPEAGGRYEVTVYQMGWRLGGKGASGRAADTGDRIEEHGLHIWMGFYENAFQVMRRCYEELGRPAGAPLATWEDAFKPHSYIVLEEQLADGWHPWQLDFPTDADKPGDGGLTLPDAPRSFQKVVSWALGHLDFVPEPRPRGGWRARRCPGAGPDAGLGGRGAREGGHPRRLPGGLCGRHAQRGPGLGPRLHLPGRRHGHLPGPSTPTRRSTRPPPSRRSPGSSTPS